MRIICNICFITKNSLCQLYPTTSMKTFWRSFNIFKDFTFNGLNLKNDIETFYKKIRNELEQNK